MMFVRVGVPSRVCVLMICRLAMLVFYDGFMCWCSMVVLRAGPIGFGVGKRFVYVSWRLCVGDCVGGECDV